MQYYEHADERDDDGCGECHAGCDTHRVHQEDDECAAKEKDAQRECNGRQVDDAQRCERDGALARRLAGVVQVVLAQPPMSGQRLDRYVAIRHWPGEHCRRALGEVGLKNLSGQGEVLACVCPVRRERAQAL
eukprot:6951413-Prymnesium_polylepis.2